MNCVGKTGRTIEGARQFAVSLKPPASPTDNSGMYPISTDDPERESAERARVDRATDRSLPDGELWGYWGNGLGEWMLLRLSRSRPVPCTAAPTAKK